jgi:hypothetical protein
MWVTKSILCIVSRINTQTQSNTDMTTGKIKDLEILCIITSLTSTYSITPPAINDSKLLEASPVDDNGVIYIHIYIIMC